MAVKPTTSMMMKKGDPAAKDSTTAGIDKTNTDQQQVLSLRNLHRDPLPSSQAGNSLTEPCLAKTSSFKTSNVSSQMMPSHSVRISIFLFFSLSSLSMSLSYYFACLVIACHSFGTCVLCSLLLFSLFFLFSILSLTSLM